MYTNLALKIVVSPLLLWLSAVLFDGLVYVNGYQIISLGLILALAGTFAEWAFLRPGMLWFNTVLDWPLNTFMIFAWTPLFRGAQATFLASVSAGLLFVFAEYAQHRWLIGRRLRALEKARAHD